jgi:flavin reductase (DIM6/NTAB) family NADH-FMN oxidoreductase RutF
MGEQDDVRNFRTVCGRFATGVTVILTDTPEGVHGMTANAFMSVSLDPLLVAVGVHRNGRMAGLLKDHGTRFSISILAREQQAAAEFYSRPGAVRTADGLDIQVTDDGLPIMARGLAWMECCTESLVEAGDHYLVLARAMRCRLDWQLSPLVFYAGHYWEHLDRERDNPIEWQLLEL